MSDWIFAPAVLLVVLSLLLCAAALYQYCDTRKTMNRLNRMLDQAIDGSFSEHAFDESLLSSVETRMNRFLSASAVSSQDIAAEREKIKELLADISHQTKTPIANILLYTQLLEEQELSEESKSCVAVLTAQAEKLRFLTASLVKLSRLETGVLTLHPCPCEILPLLTSCAEQFYSSAADKNIVLTVSQTDATACFDPKWTAEAICNLLDNAIKYTLPGGSVHVSATAYELFCRIDVSDSGIGITEDEQARIFTRFYRSRSVSGQEGAGIGLYLTRQILSEQGGYVKVASRLNHGSVFSAFLPRPL